jgi:hypothetical protein
MQNMVNILGLDSLYAKEEMTEFAEKAARNINGALTDLGLPQSATMDLIKTNLFRCYIFCGNVTCCCASISKLTVF